MRSNSNSEIPHFLRNDSLFNACKGTEGCGRSPHPSIPNLNSKSVIPKQVRDGTKWSEESHSQLPLWQNIKFLKKSVGRTINKHKINNL